MFITFEGPEGGGKTYQITLLAKYLKERGFSVITTREPGGTSIGNQVRAILSDHKNTAMHPRTELLLFQASRSQLVEEMIVHHLAKKDIILCDRYADSTLAYQGYGHQQFKLEDVQALINFATSGLKPDLTFLLDVDVEEGLSRKSKGGEWNRLDAYELDFHKRVRQGYFHLVKTEPDRWVVVDARKPPDIVQAEIQRIILERLN